MSTGRGDAVERPKPWRFVFGDRAAAKGWAEIVRTATNGADTAWVAITSEPRRTDNRQHQLKGSLSTGSHAGRTLPQWQFEVTGGGRIWYLIDEDNRTLIMTAAGTGHPKATDKGVRRGRR